MNRNEDNKNNTKTNVHTQNNNNNNKFYQVHGHVLLPRSSNKEDEEEEEEEEGEVPPKKTTNKTGGWFGFSIVGGGGRQLQEKEKDLVEQIRDKTKRSKRMIVILNTGLIRLNLKKNDVEIKLTIDSKLPSTYEGMHASCRYFLSLKDKNESTYQHRRIYQGIKQHTQYMTPSVHHECHYPILSKLYLYDLDEQNNSKVSLSHHHDEEKRFNLKRHDGTVLAKLSYHRDHHEDSNVVGKIEFQVLRDENNNNDGDDDEHSFVQLDALRMETIDVTTTTEIMQSLKLETTRALVLPFRISYGKRRSCLSRPVQTNHYKSTWSLRLRFSIPHQTLEWTFPVSNFDDGATKEQLYQRKCKIEVINNDVDSLITLDDAIWNDHLTF
ncbi:hypothetical protein OAV88_03340 [bacterium]|nr:hypothetical protein [bacterium]